MSQIELKKINKIARQKRANNEPIMSENTLHLRCVEWIYKEYGENGIIAHHSPNENPAKGGFQTMLYNKKMKTLGRLAGYLDLTIFFQGRVLLIELKAETGTFSDYQEELFPRFEANGFKVHIAWSLEKFKEIVNQFMLNYDPKPADFFTKPMNRGILTPTF